MSLKKTACLASMLLSFPLAAPSMSVAEDFDPNKDIQTAGEAISSGTKDSPQTATLGAGPYDNVYIGHAVINGAKAVGSAEANWNKGEIDKAVTVNGHIYGGCANGPKTYNSAVIATEAKGNTLILKKGSSIEMTFVDKVLNPTTAEWEEVGPDIYAGYADGGYNLGRADASANENTFIIEEGASLKHTSGKTVNIYGGYAHSYLGAADTSASYNKVTIKEGADIEASLSVRVGYAQIQLNMNNSVDVTASYNELSVQQAKVTFAGAKENDLTIGYAFNASSGKAVASNNTGTLEGENIVINGTVTVRSGFAQHTDSEGEAYANENRLTISGVKFLCETNKYSIYTGRAWGRGKVYANGNITSIASVDNKGDIAGGYAEGYYYFDSSPVTNTYANNNITTITDSTMYIARAGFARFGAYAEAEGNRLSMSGGQGYAVVP